MGNCLNKDFSIDAFYSACAEGNLTFVKKNLIYVLEKNSNAVNSEISQALCVACFYGKLNIVEWMLSLEKNMNCNLFNHNKAFAFACANGYSNIANLILSNKKVILNEKIYIKNFGFVSYQQCALILACKNNKIEIVKWLLNETPDLHNTEHIQFLNNLFCETFKNESFEVASHLLSI